MTKKNFERKNILENKAISISALQKGDLIQIEWSDASEVRARLSEHYESPEATVYEWGIFLGVSERRKRKYLLLGKEVALPWKEWGAVRVPLDILDKIHIIKPKFCQVLPVGVLRKIRIRPARGYIFLRKFRLRESIRRALTRQIPIAQSHGKKIRVKEEVPPSEKLVLGVTFAIIALLSLTALEIAYMVVVKQFSSEIFAVISGLIGTILGVFFGVKA